MTTRPVPDTRSAGEREMLESMLDWYRAGVIAKVEGISPAHLRATPLPSATSIAGLVKHLALVEDGWFHRFEGVPDPEPWASADWEADPDWEFHSAVDQTLPELVALYQEACERSRATAARHELGEPAVEADSRGRPFTLRFVLVHLLEETARHLGHLDILRESLDGTTGD